LRRTTLAMLILGILTATAGCSLFRYNHKPDSPPQTRRINPQARQVVRGRIIPACRTQSGRQDRPQNAPYIKRIKFRVKIKPYMYTYQVAWSATTDQFVLTSVSPKVNPPHIRRTSPPQTRRVKPLERAHKVRLAITLPGSAVSQADSQARLTANGGQAGKPSRPAPGKPLNQSGDVVHAKVRMENGEGDHPFFIWFYCYQPFRADEAPQGRSEDQETSWRQGQCGRLHLPACRGHSGRLDRAKKGQRKARPWPGHGRCPRAGQGGCQGWLGQLQGQVLLH